MSNYEILGLNKGATIPQIKKKFRELCMIHHPDKGGNQALFIKIKDAYEALLKGDSGEKKQDSYSGYGREPKSQQQQQQYRRYQEDQRAREAWEFQKARNRIGEYRFVHIKKDHDGYLIRFYVRNIRAIYIYGKDGMRVGLYNCRHIDGYTNLVLSYEDAKTAEYFFKIRLEGYDNDSATVTYKVKPPFKPNWWQKILIKLGKKYE